MIPGDIRAIIKGTKLDTGVYLDSLKGMTPDEQRAKVRIDLAEPKKTVKPGREFSSDSRQNHWIPPIVFVGWIRRLLLDTTQTGAAPNTLP